MTPRLPISPQRMAILAALTTGETTAETAQRLFLSPRTVQTHRRLLYRQLGADNAAHAVGIAFRAGILRARRCGS